MQGSCPDDIDVNDDDDDDDWNNNNIIRIYYNNLRNEDYRVLP